MGVLEESKDLGSASDWMKEISTNPKYYPDLGWHVISMKFLHSFLRRHFARNQEHCKMSAVSIGYHVQWMDKV